MTVIGVIFYLKSLCKEMSLGRGSLGGGGGEIRGLGGGGGGEDIPGLPPPPLYETLTHFEPFNL